MVLRAGGWAPKFFAVNGAQGAPPHWGVRRMGLQVRWHSPGSGRLQTPHFCALLLLGLQSGAHLLCATATRFQSGTSFSFSVFFFHTSHISASVIDSFWSSAPRDRRWDLNSVHSTLASCTLRRSSSTSRWFGATPAVCQLDDEYHTFYRRWCWAGSLLRRCPPFSTAHGIPFVSCSRVVFGILRAYSWC